MRILYIFVCVKHLFGFIFGVDFPLLFCCCQVNQDQIGCVGFKNRRGSQESTNTSSSHDVVSGMRIRCIGGKTHLTEKQNICIVWDGWME